MKKINIKSKKDINDQTVDLTKSTEIIKTIYHISDIHISKNTTRHPEYRLVFQNLVNAIKSNTKNSLITVTGDICHEKSIMSPEQILLVTEFFIKLSNLCPVIAIVGNHDCANQNTIDAISPIVNNLMTKNPVHLLLENKVYTYSNIAFGLTTMFTKEITKCNVKNKIKIGLYHGIIESSTTDNNYSFGNNNYFKADDFAKQYDITMLGDIHKMNYLNEKRTIAYAGSLIQQNISEHPYDHGMIKWDLETKTSEFIRIPNDHAMIKIEIDKQGIKPYDQKMAPLIPTFYLYYSDISLTEATEYSKFLRAEHPNAKCLINCVKNVSDVEITIGGGKDKKKMAEIKDNETVKKIIMDYAKKKNIITDLTKEQKDKLATTLDLLISNTEHKFGTTTKHFKLKSLMFNNYFLYGEDNKIDFSALAGIIGLQGKSGSGKSTIVDVLIYSIFGEMVRGTMSDIMRIGQKENSTTVIFEINDDTYKITRSRKKESADKTKTDKEVKLYKNGKDITEDTIDITNERVEEIVGSYKDFINVAIMLQRGGQSYVDLSSAKRKEIICKLLKIDIFNDIMMDATNKLKAINKEINLMCEMKASTKKHKKIAELPNKLKDLDEEEKKLNDSIKVITKQYNDVKKKLDEKNTDLLEQEFKLKKYQKINISESEINTIESSISKLNVSEAKIKKEIEKLNQSNEQYQTNLDKLINIYKKNNAKTIETRYKKFMKDKESEISKLTKQYEKFLESKRHITNNINHSKITVELNKFMSDKEAIDNEHKSIFQQLGDLEIKKVKKNDTYKLNYDKLIKSRDGLAELKKEISILTKEKLALENKIKQLEKHDYDPKCKYCMKYSITKDKIAYTKTLNDNKNKLDEIQNEIDREQDCIEKLNRYEALYNDYVDKINEYNNNEIKKKEFTSALTLLEKDLEIVNNKINNHTKIIDEYNKNLEAVKENNKIDIECESIKKMIKEKQNEKSEEYENYLNNIKEKDILEDKINKTKLEIKSKILEQTETQNKLSELVKQKIKIEENKDMINEKKEITKLKINTQNDINILKKQEEEIRKTQESAKNKLMQITFDKKNENALIKKYNDVIIERDAYETIMKIFGKNDGLINYILINSVFPSLENHINKILKIISNYQIKLVCNGSGIDIMKVNGSDETVLNMDTISGGESFMANVATKLALSEYNSFLKCNFIVIDEAFMYCDEATVAKMPNLFTYIKSQFTWALVISHDDRIIKLYDSSYYVKNDGLSSSIVIE